MSREKRIESQASLQFQSRMNALKITLIEPPALLAFFPQLPSCRQSRLVFTKKASGWSQPTRNPRRDLHDSRDGSPNPFDSMFGVHSVFLLGNTRKARDTVSWSCCLKPCFRRIEVIGEL